CISIAVGLIFIAVGLSAKSGQLFETISTYFENAYEFSGGKNIVNAILGDFRAFDTMLEVIVFFIGGLGVYTLVKQRQKKGDENHENQCCHFAHGYESRRLYHFDVGLLLIYSGSRSSRWGIYCRTCSSLGVCITFSCI